MSESIRQWTKKIREQFAFEAGSVLDVGSLNVNGTVKDLFADAKEYVGIDFRAGKDVDIVMNAHDIEDRFEKKFDTIVCMNMLEHDNYFWLTYKAMFKVLKNGGYLFVVVPTFGFPVHEHPRDYWRFGEDAFRDVIFDKNHFELLNLESVNTKPNINPVLCGFGRKI